MTPARIGFALIATLTVTLLSGCAGGGHYHYRYVPGKTAVMRGDGRAEAPPGAPPAVHAAIAAGNEIVGMPYVYGGGQSRNGNTGYDCSGAVSYVLRGAEKLRGTMTSTGFRRYGSPGEGDWITVYARKGHVFLVVAGLRYDTGWTRSGKQGPQWTTESRPLGKAVARHPAGL